MGTLEQDALEVFRLVQSMKNLLGPIHRIPNDVLSLLPDYVEDECTWDERLITLTHVCRRWRDVFTSRSSLWTHLDFENIDKTHVYIQRSKSSPLRISIQDYEHTFSDHGFPLVAPHLHRLKSLIIYGDSTSEVFKRCRFQVQLLEELEIRLASDHEIVLEDDFLNGNLSSLRKLTLDGVATGLPWGNLANLRVFTIRFATPELGITQLLDFFESAPLLDTINLAYPIPISSDAPPNRIVPLPHLKTLRVSTDSAHTVLLNHLSIPIGASVTQEFSYSDDRFPLADYLPKSVVNLGNLSQVTTINFSFRWRDKFLRLAGPNGEHRILAFWDNWTSSPLAVNKSILDSIDPRILSTIRGLSFTDCDLSRDLTETNGYPVFETLSLTENLRKLVVSNCNILPFIHSLDPARNSSESLLCPHLEEILVYIDLFREVHSPITVMAKNRASRGAKLRSITIVLMDLPKNRESRLEADATHVECRIGGALPPWDELACE